MSRIDAREKAMQVLYQLESQDKDIVSQLDKFLEDRTYSSEDGIRMTVASYASIEDGEEVTEEFLAIKQSNDLYKADLEDGIIVELTKKDVTYLRNLVLGVWNHKDELDQSYDKYLKNWTVARLPILERVLLRIGTYEILKDESVPDSVAINEVIELSHKYVEEDSYSYINAILGKVSLNKED